MKKMSEDRGGLMGNVRTNAATQCKRNPQNSEKKRFKVSDITNINYYINSKYKNIMLLYVLLKRSDLICQARYSFSCSDLWRPVN